MAERITRLAYIMSRLGIRAEEVSKRTGIDKTLISRWRSGQRKLSPASVYSKRIGSFLLSLDNAESIILKTLNAYGLDESSGSLQDNFSFWLAEQDLPSPSLRNIMPKADSREYTASFRIFLGGEGLRSAIITMIDYVMTLQGPQNIVAVAFSDFTWITEDPDFLALLVERLSVAFERGVTLTLIGKKDFSEALSHFSGLWLKAHLQGYIKSYYNREEHTEGEEKIFLAVKDGVCLRLEHDAAVADGMYAAMYTDRVTVLHTYNDCMDYFSRASMQFRYGFFHKPDGFLKNLPGEGLFSDNCYVCAHIPSVGAIDYRQVHLYAKETLRDSKQITDQVKALFTTPNQFVSTAKVRHIYCLDSIEALLSPGRTVNYPLSAIYKKRVHHSHKMALEQLANIRGWMQTCENYEVAFVPAHIFDRLPLEFICVQNNFCASWLNDASVSTCVKDNNKVATLFGYADYMWDKLPKYGKDRRRVLRLLNQWLARE